LARISREDIMTETAAPLSGQEGRARLSWAAARLAAHRAGAAAMLDEINLPLAECDGSTLAADLLAACDLPPFPVSAVDGYAVRGAGPWRLTGRVLPGERAPALDCDGSAVEIATGAMTPAGISAVLRSEDSVISGCHVSGAPRPKREWRPRGEEARRDERLLPGGTPVTPAAIGLAAASGHDCLRVRPRPRAVVVVLGSELITAGQPGGGRVRDALGPQLPAWLGRFGAATTIPSVIGPVNDTLDACLAALSRAQAADPDIIVTTGGTMRGPVDELRSALRELEAGYLVDTVDVRPGGPMMLAALPGRAGGGRTLLAGLPGNPQAAIVALLTLVTPALAGLTGRELPGLPAIELGAPIPGRGDRTHLALVSRGPDGCGYPVAQAGSAMLRGLAHAAGFAVIAPRQAAGVGDLVPFLPLPLSAGEGG
jgi:molybdopterin molybdotransferase